MPTYQYACTSCGERLEVVQKFTDDPLTVCPACSGKLRKVFSAVGVVFKGSGFYKTDSRSAAKSGSAAGSSSSAKATGDSDGGSGTGTSADSAKPAEAKPAAASKTSGDTSSAGGSSGDRVA